MEQTNLITLVIVLGFLFGILLPLAIVLHFIFKTAQKPQRYSGRIMEVTKVTELKPGSTYHLHPEEYAELERDIKGKEPVELIPGQKPYDRDQSLIDAKNRHDQHAARVKAFYEQQQELNKNGGFGPYIDSLDNETEA